MGRRDIEKGLEGMMWWGRKSYGATVSGQRDDARRRCGGDGTTAWVGRDGQARRRVVCGGGEETAWRGGGMGRRRREEEGMGAPGTDACWGGGAMGFCERRFDRRIVGGISSVFHAKEKEK